MRGILFKPDMIKAIVEGRKTKTRRIVKPEPDNLELLKRWCKPRYLPGETVYIKEAWQIFGYRFLEWAKIRYALDGAVKQVIWDDWLEKNTVYGAGGDTEWRTPMFLREAFARYFIKIKAVEPQRLQEITEEDAKAEGFNEWEYNNPDAYADFPCTNQFIQTWDSINKPPYEWQANPWVWRYEFVVQPRGREIAPNTDRR